MADQPSLPRRYHEGLSEVYALVRRAQLRAAGLKGEASLEGAEFKPLVDTLERKSAALGHLLEDLAAIPNRVAEHQAELERRRGGGSK